MSQKKVNPKIKQPAAKAPAAPAAVKELIAARYLNPILIAILFILVAVIYFPVAFQNMEPQPTDISQWRGAAQSIVEYNSTHKDKALWTQNMFSGMPSYMISFPNRYPFLEAATRLTDKVMNWRILLLFIGGLGIFVLMRGLGLEPWIAFFAALSFSFSCHWVGLLDIGHNTKFRAMMYVPWVFWALMRLHKKPGLLSLGLLATFLITQLRENHPQISYYLYILMGFYWIYQLILAIKNKEHKTFWLWTLLIIVAFGLTLLAVMNPYLSTMEYSHHTMRGGAGGLDKAYAQGWSFHPKEILGLIIPDFYGGIAHPAGNHYWGYMPFTQVYNYFGILVLALGILGLFSSQKSLARFFWLSSAFFTIISFGSATPWLSDLFLKYLPYFNKFRVPSMSLIIVQFNAVILAGLGLLQVSENIGNAYWQKLYQRIFWVLGGVFIIWLVGAKYIFGGLSFAQADELLRYQEAGAQAMAHFEGIKTTRLSMLVKSGILSLLLLTVSMGLVYLSSIRKLRLEILFILLSVITMLDLMPYTGKHLQKEYLKPVSNRAVHFKMQDYDQFLLSQGDEHRIFPFNFKFDQSSRNNLRPAGEWAYYHQTTDGYSAAKLKRYDEIMPLIGGNDGEFMRYLRGVFSEESSEISMPLLSMLSTKYIILPDSIPYGSQLESIRPVFNNGKLSIYENLAALPRAWFVNRTELIGDKDERIKRLADPGFQPATTAILETDIAGISAADSTFIRQTTAEMHELAYELYTDQNSLLVLSEVYYPAGWKAYLDGTQIPIYPVNHVLRGLQIPPGEHELRLVFQPANYKKSVMLSLAGLTITALCLLVGLVYHFRL